jgi:hypothetical protein
LMPSARFRREPELAQQSSPIIQCQSARYLLRASPRSSLSLAAVSPVNSI